MSTDIRSLLGAVCSPSLARSGLRSLKRDGLRLTLRRVLHVLRGAPAPLKDPGPLYSEEELAAQRAEFPAPTLRFSLVTPFVCVPEARLRQTVEAVLEQSCPDWELLLADGGDGALEALCRGYAERDGRIRYLKSDSPGLTAAANAALAQARGEYAALVDAGDLPHPAALYALTRAIGETGAELLYTDEERVGEAAVFKPFYGPDTLCGCDSVGRLLVFRRALLAEIGPLDPKCEGAYSHDLALRLTERTRRIAHIPEPLYRRRADAKADTPAAAVRAVEKRLERLGLAGEVTPVRPGLPVCRVRYAIRGTPKVSILIPNHEHQKDLQSCLDSIFEKTSWTDYELVIVENNSRSPALFAYYDKLRREHENLRVVTWEGAFNYSAVNNYGARFCSGEYLLLLNNDAEVLTPDWIQELLMFAQRPDVGAVGALLLYPDGSVQHAGVGLGLGSAAGHLFCGTDGRSAGYQNRLLYAQDLTAVTAACLLVRRRVWDELGSLDEGWALAYNDVDFCLRLRRAGYYNVWTPFAALRHYESKSRGSEDTPEKQARFQGELTRLRERWGAELSAGDPYLNPNFTLSRPDFRVDPARRRHPARTFALGE